MGIADATSVYAELVINYNICFWLLTLLGFWLLITKRAKDIEIHNRKYLDHTSKNDHCEYYIDNSDLG
jgi:hypothetical protein